MLRYLTAGESHGPALTVVVEGLPAGLPVTVEQIGDELARRRLGFGRGPAHALRARRRRAPRRRPPRSHPRVAGLDRDPQHRVAEVAGGDVAGAGRHREAAPPAPARPRRPRRHAEVRLRRRPQRARAGQRPGDRRPRRGRRARQAAPRRARHRRAQPRDPDGRRPAPTSRAGPTPGDLDAVDDSPVRCFDPAAEAAMVAEVEAAAKVGDSLGGVVEVLGYGVPPGLGSHVHWDRKIDGLLAQALMSIQAMKGVEIGDGFEVAGRRGSEAHDEILWDADAGEYIARLDPRRWHRGRHDHRRPARGPRRDEAARHAQPAGAATVDTETKEETVSFKERTDVTAVPAAGCGGRDDGRARARAARRPASSAATRSRSSRATTPRTSRRCGRGDAERARHLVLVGLMGAGKTTVGQRCAERLDRPFVDTDELVESPRAGCRWRDLRPRRRAAVPRARARRGGRRVRVARRRSSIACGGGAVLDADDPARLRATGVVVWLQAPAAGSARASATRTTTTPPARCRVQTRVATLERLRRAARARLRSRRPRAWSTPTGAASTRSPTAVIEELAAPSGAGDAIAARRAPDARLRRRRRRRRARPRPGSSARRAPPRSRSSASPGSPTSTRPALTAALHAAGADHRPVPHGRRRGRQVARHRRRPVLAARRVGAAARRRGRRPRRRRGGRHRGVRRRRSTTAASRSCRRRPRCSPRSTPPSAARPRSTCPRARTSSARSTSRCGVFADVATLATLPPRSTAPASARWPSTR